jgi:hypothetical protein
LGSYYWSLGKSSKHFGKPYNFLPSLVLALHNNDIFNIDFDAINPIHHRTAVILPIKELSLQEFKGIKKLFQNEQKDCLFAKHDDSHFRHWLW